MKIKKLQKCDHAGNEIAVECGKESEGVIK